MFSAVQPGAARLIQSGRTRRDSRRAPFRAPSVVRGCRASEERPAAPGKRLQSAALVGLAGTFAAVQLILSAPSLAAPGCALSPVANRQGQTALARTQGQATNVASTAAADAPAVRTGPITARDIERDIEQSLQRELLFLEMELDKKRLALEVEVQRSRIEAEQSGRVQDGQLCATPYGVDIVGITEAIALAGALFGGISSRQRKREVEELNDKLRTINMSLRQQSRSGMVYAPGLNYAPMSSTATPVIDFSQPVRIAPPPPPPDAAPDEVRSALREGRAKLKEGNGAAGMVFFNKAMMISKMRADKGQLRRAMRGLAACRRMGGDKLGAIEDLELVLKLSSEMNEFTGDADALGAIADMYTARHRGSGCLELGDLEKAGVYYDRYINVLTSDSAGQVD